MNVRSLGWRSELALIDGEIIDRQSYLVVRSPAQPGYYWGNLLVFAGPPVKDELERWEALFAREFDDLPEVLHRTFAWDLAEECNELGPFAQAGYHVEKTVVLTASRVQPPPHLNLEIEVRVLRGQGEWDQVEEQQVASRDLGHEEGAYRKFVAAHLAGLRARVDAGQGEWYGAFLGGRMAGNLGIFRAGREARFQVVVTAPEMRRQGVCGTLVHHVAQATLDRPDIESLVMLADAEYHAARIYESVGFSATEKLEGLCLWPR